VILKNLKINKERLLMEYAKWTIAILTGICIGVVIGFSVYHYFFMDKFSCCGVYG
jgi:hypothetical protein